MRTFEHFPDSGIVCPICGKNTDETTVLIPISTIEDGSCVEAKPVHLDCVLKCAYYYPEHHAIVINAYM